MLPTLGLFRVCPCPYYVVGLCERPHCCFRHCRSDVEASRRESAMVEAEDGVEMDHQGASKSNVADSKIRLEEKGNEDDKKPRLSLSAEDTKGKSEAKGITELNSSRVGLKRSIDSEERKVEYSVKRSKVDDHLNGSVDQDKSGQSKKTEVLASHPLSVGNGSLEHKNSEKSKSRSSDDKSHKSKSISSSSDKDKSKHKSSHDQHKTHTSKHKVHKDKDSSSRHSHSSHRSLNRSSSSSSSSKNKDSESKRSHGDKHPHKHKSSSSSSSTKKYTTDSSSNKSTSELPDIIELNTTEPVITAFDSSSIVTINLDEDSTVPDDFLYPSDEEDDPDQIAMECYKMFQDYKSDDSGVESIRLETVPESKPAEPGESSSDSANIGKKRVAHPSAAKPSMEKVQPPKRKESAREQLIRRMESVKGTVTSIVIPPPLPPAVPAPVPPPTSPNKKRIAHVSNPTALMKPLARSTSLPMSGNGAKVDSAAHRTNGYDAITLSQTVPKGEKRFAHAPKPIVQASAGVAPKIVPDLRSKVPAVIRQKFLEQIYREFLQLCPDSASASSKAVEEEKTLLAKCNTKQVYSCSATNLIARLRKQYREVSTEISGSSTVSGNKIVSHSDILAGKAGGSVSWSIEKKTSVVPVGAQLYQRLTDYLMSYPELIDNGYPRKCPTSFKGCSGPALIKAREDCSYSRVIEESNRKKCDRCGVAYVVDEDGFPKLKDLCTYHSGRRFGRRTRTGNAESRYTCCEGDLNSTGCCTANCHVFSGKSPDDLKNFICAALDPGDSATMGMNPWDVIGVDCEMVYTTHGTELARATFVDVNGKLLYDTLVKPAHPVLDHNTRFSGIDEDMLKNTTTTIKEVHLKILANVRPNTIIVGHSLENDLIALKLIHGCVVDTSLVFPHKRGPPFKRALRNLSAECLGKIIQTGEGGHDSAEDARAALDLMLWKVKNDSGKTSSRKSGSD